MVQAACVHVPPIIADEFVAAFDDRAAANLATTLTCEEVDAMAALLEIFGQPRLADVWVAIHADGDDKEDAHWVSDDDQDDAEQAGEEEEARA